MKVAEHGEKIYSGMSLAVQSVLFGEKEGEYMRWPAVWPCGKSFYSL